MVICLELGADLLLNGCIGAASATGMCVCVCVCVCVGTSTKHCRSFLADGLGAEESSCYHVESYH